MQKRDKVRLDFTHEELYAFYSKVCYVCGALNYNNYTLSLAAKFFPSSWRQYKNN